MASTYTPIATQTLSSDSNYITFNSLGSYTDIIAVANARSTTTGGVSDIYIRLATGGGSIDTGTNYSSTRLFGDGSSAYSDRYSNQTLMYFGSIPASTAPTSAFGTCVWHFQNYGNSTTYKTCLQRGSSVDTANNLGYATTGAGLWRNTGAITSIQIITNANFKAGSQFTIYGIKAA